jgi:hypothetical protein
MAISSYLATQEIPPHGVFENHVKCFARRVAGQLPTATGRPPMCLARNGFYGNARVVHIRLLSDNALRW